MFDTAILLIIYNRPDKTARVLDAIRQIKPARLFVAADGPKDSADNILCSQTRDLITQIDWHCELLTHYNDKNKGCKHAVSSGITWFFKNVEQGIILEDDCVPSKSFFIFCAETLNKYKHHHKIMHITGAKISGPPAVSAFTYYFSKYPNIWGWATWRRAWEKYDLDLADKKAYLKVINSNFKDPFERRFWRGIFYSLATLDTWDYQWMFSIWKAGGICISTHYNFIDNIGFDATATHTTWDSPYKSIQKLDVAAIVHPTEISIDKVADKDFLAKVHGLVQTGYFSYTLMRGRNLVHKVKLFLAN